MADPIDGQQLEETLAPAGTTTVHTDNGSQNADAEALKQELKKLEMERNLLRKQKDALEKERLEREKKELEEKEDYRTLAERAQTELETLRKEREEADARAAAQSATSEIFAGFDSKVVEVARTAGLSAADGSEESRTALQTKLKAIQDQLGITGTPRVMGSNPAPVASEEAFDPIRAGKMMRVDDRTLREPAIKQAIGRHPQVAAFREYGKQANNVAPRPL